MGKSRPPVLADPHIARGSALENYFKNLSAKQEKRVLNVFAKNLRPLNAGNPIENLKFLLDDNGNLKKEKEVKKALRASGTNPHYKSALRKLFEQAGGLELPYTAKKQLGDILKNIKHDTHETTMSNNIARDSALENYFKKLSTQQEKRVLELFALNFRPLNAGNPIKNLKFLLDDNGNLKKENEVEKTLRATCTNPNYKLSLRKLFEQAGGLELPYTAKKQLGDILKNIKHDTHETTMSNNIARDSAFENYFKKLFPKQEKRALNLFAKNLRPLNAGNPIENLKFLLDDNGNLKKENEVKKALRASGTNPHYKSALRKLFEQAGGLELPYTAKKQLGDILKNIKCYTNEIKMSDDIARDSALENYFKELSVQKKKSALNLFAKNLRPLNAGNPIENLKFLLDDNGNLKKEVEKTLRSTGTNPNYKSALRKFFEEAGGLELPDTAKKQLGDILKNIKHDTNEATMSNNIARDSAFENYFKKCSMQWEKRPLNLFAKNLRPLNAGNPIENLKFLVTNEGNLKEGVGKAVKNTCTNPEYKKALKKLFQATDFNLHEIARNNLQKLLESHTIQVNKGKRKCEGVSKQKKGKRARTESSEQERNSSLRESSSPSASKHHEGEYEEISSGEQGITEPSTPRSSLHESNVGESGSVSLSRYREGIGDNSGQATSERNTYSATEEQSALSSIGLQGAHVRQAQGRLDTLPSDSFPEREASSESPGFGDLLRDPADPMSSLYQETLPEFNADFEEADYDMLRELFPIDVQASFPAQGITDQSTFGLVDTFNQPATTDFNTDSFLRNPESPETLQPAAQRVAMNASDLGGGEQTRLSLRSDVAHRTERGPRIQIQVGDPRLSATAAGYPTRPPSPTSGHGGR